MRRRAFMTFAAGAVVLSRAARAQQLTLPVIGFVNAGTQAAYTPYATAFRRGLAAAGYEEGRSLIIEYRWAEGQTERGPALVAELVRRQVAVLVVTASTALVFAAKAATPSIPIVFAIGADPVKFGLVASLNRPGGPCHRRELPGESSDRKAARSAARDRSEGRGDRFPDEPGQSERSGGHR
jgi:putative tryptophan/tyrosine transport system substrate-binding protein